MAVGILRHRLSSHASQGIWLLKQFIWQLGPELDGKLAAASWDHCLGDDKQHSDVLLARYFLASRKAFKSCRVLHVALDASRVEQEPHEHSCSATVQYCRLAPTSGHQG